MGQVKAKTHLEKLGFSDSDKKESKHDLIQKWVEENIKTIISDTFMSKNPHPYEILNVSWEYPIIYNNGNYKMLVGYIDIVARIKGNFYFNDSKEYENAEKYAFIEIKTAIPSLGELIRQMRAYQSYNNEKSTFYIIVSPDDRHIETLNSQGFYFYKYKDQNQLF